MARAGGRAALQARDRGQDHPQAEVRHPRYRAARTRWRWRSRTRSTPTRSRCTSTSSTTRPRRTTRSRSRSSTSRRARRRATPELDGLMLDLAQMTRLRGGGAEGLRALPAGRDGRQRRRRAPPGGGDGPLRRAARGGAVVVAVGLDAWADKLEADPKWAGSTVTQEQVDDLLPIIARVRQDGLDAGERQEFQDAGLDDAAIAKLTAELTEDDLADVRVDVPIETVLRDAAADAPRAGARVRRDRPRGRGRGAVDQRPAGRELHRDARERRASAEGHVPRHLDGRRRRPADGHLGLRRRQRRPQRARRSSTPSPPAPTRSPRPSPTASSPRPRRARSPPWTRPTCRRSPTPAPTSRSPRTRLPPSTRAAPADPDGTIVEYTWDFGDDSGPVETSGSHTSPRATGGRDLHRPPRRHRRRRRRPREDTAAVTVGNRPPTVSIGTYPRAPVGRTRPYSAERRDGARRADRRSRWTSATAARAPRRRSARPPRPRSTTRTRHRATTSSSSRSPTARGRSATAEREVHVADAVAEAGADVTVDEGEEVTLGGASTPGDEYTSVTWDLGDGSPQATEGDAAATPTATTASTRPR